MIDNLTLRELRLLKEALHEPIWKHPDAPGLPSLVAAIDQRLQADPRYRKGEAILRAAEEDGGLGDGYAKASDYYFAVTHDEVRNHQEEVIGKHVQLLLCMKWNWWMNGEDFNVHGDGEPSRNFHEFLTPEMRERWEEEFDYTDDPQELRTQLLSAGLEELPALIPIYENYIQMAQERRRQERASFLSGRSVS